MSAARLGLLGLTSLLFAATADAAPPKAADATAPRYTRESGRVSTKNTLETRVKAAQQQAEADRKRRVEMIDAERYAKDRAATREDVADAQIEKLRKLISITEEGSSELPELLFRLADLYLEKKT